MSAIRSLAMKVAGFTVRHASAGSREWAEGVAREVGFIDSDWRALAWALGSMRVLLDRRSRSVDGKRRRPGVMDWSGWIWQGAFAFDFAIDAAVAKDWHVRVGSALAAFGWSYFGVSSIIEWLRNGSEPTEFVAGTLHARALLMKKLARARTMRRWIPIGVLMVGWFGFLLAHPHIVWWQRELAMASLIVTSSLQEDSPKKIEARIARVDFRLARYQAERVRELSEKPVKVDMLASPTFSRLFRRRRRCRRLGLR